jgi:hypothetical protein
MRVRDMVLGGVALGARIRQAVGDKRPRCSAVHAEQTAEPNNHTLANGLRAIDNRRREGFVGFRVAIEF